MDLVFIMVLTKKERMDRMETLVKAYLTLKGYGTARQIFEFIDTNNFGLSITQGTVVNYLKNNIHADYKSGRGCMKNCYGYIEKGHNRRMYYIKE